MARIIYGSIITDIKGSIGGITYQKNGSGQIARLKPRKNQTNTQKQRDQQPRLKGIQREWNELTLVNKVLWNDFASVNNKIGLDGNPKTLTGYQWFLTINQNRLLFDDPILVVPPVYEIVNPITSLEFRYDGVNLKVSALNAPIQVQSRSLIYCSFVLNSVSKFDYNKCRLLVSWTESTDEDFYLDVPSIYKYWSNYYNQSFPPNINGKSFYLVAYVKTISTSSGISSLAYSAIAKFVWDGAKYVIE